MSISREAPPLHARGDVVLSRYWQADAGMYQERPATVLEAVDRPAETASGCSAGEWLQIYKLQFLHCGTERYRLPEEVKPLPMLEPARFTLAQTRALLATFAATPGVGAPYPTQGPDKVPLTTLRALEGKGAARRVADGEWEATKEGRDAFLSLIPWRSAQLLVEANAVPRERRLFMADHWCKVIHRDQARVRAVAKNQGAFIPHLVTVARSASRDRTWSSNGAHERWITRYAWWVRCHTCGHVRVTDGPAGPRLARQLKTEHQLEG